MTSGDPEDRTFRAHPWHGVSMGKDAPRVVTTYIEIVPTDTVKYEMDKLTGILRMTATSAVVSSTLAARSSRSTVPSAVARTDATGHPSSASDFAVFITAWCSIAE